MLKLQVLGIPSLEINGQPVHLSRRKALALLVYLAVTGREHQREALALMFWQDSDPARGKMALRRVLSDLHQALHGDALVIERDTVRFNLTPDTWVDAVVFRQHVRSSTLSGMIDLYQGDFLTGFTLPDSPAFDEWQLLQTEYFRREYLSALQQVITSKAEDGLYDDSITLARRWLSADPLMMQPNYTLIQLYALTGRRADALRQYDHYARTLKQELDTEPEEVVKHLVDAVRRGDIRRAAPRQEQLPVNEPVMEEEIRLVTVLVVGLVLSPSTSLSNMSAAHQRLQQVAAQTAARYQGQVIGGMPLQLVFGADETHEDDAERALYAAFEIHQSGLHITCGVSTGMSVVQRAGQRVRGMIGAAVNTALWLQQNVGQQNVGQHVVGQQNAAFFPLVSAATYRAIQRIFECEALTMTMAGETLEVYRVLRPIPAHTSGLNNHSVRLVGREPELHRLKQLVGGLSSGGGQFVMVAGDAGIGKSRLIAELRRMDFPVCWLEGRGTELRSKISYSVLIDIIHTYLYNADPESLLVELMGTRGKEIAAVFEGLLGGLYEGSSPEQARYQIFTALYDFFVALARHKPTVLVIDDVHRADDLSLDFIAYLTEALPTEALMIVCVSRPYERPRLAQLDLLARQRGYYTRIELHELTTDEQRALVASLLAHRASTALQDDILQFAQGNPLFIEEIVRELIERGQIEQRDGLWFAREAVTLNVPESLQGIVLSRVDHLAPALRSVIQRAAVIGLFFNPAVLKTLFPPDFDLNSALWELEKSALIYRERIFPDERYAFKHVVIQNAVYQSLTQRQTLHEHIAQALETLYTPNLTPYYEQLAHHYALSADDHKAIHYLVKAGEKARQTGLNHEAIHLLQNALSRLEWHPDMEDADRIRFKILHHLGKTYYGLGQMPEAEICLKQALNFARDIEKSTLINVYFWLAEAYHWQAKFNDEIATGQRGHALLSDDEQQTLEAALMNQTIAVANIHKGHWDIYRDMTRRTAAFLETLPYVEELRAAYMHVIELYLDTDFEMARVWLDKVETLAKRHHDLRSAAEVIEHRCWLALKTGAYEDGLRYAEAALAQYQKYNDQTRFFRVMGHQTWLLHMRGDTAAAEMRAREALTYARGLQNPFTLMDAWLNLGYMLLGRQSPETETAFKNAMDIATTYRLDWVYATAAFGLGWFYHQTGRDPRPYLEAAQEKSGGNLLLTWCLRNISLTSFVEFVHHPADIDAPEWLKRLLGV